MAVGRSSPEVSEQVFWPCSSRLSFLWRGNTTQAFQALKVVKKRMLFPTGGVLEAGSKQRKTL